MKTVLMIGSLVLLTGLQVTAMPRGQDGNGGDICEDRFKIVRDDLSSWLAKGGASALQLPSGLSLNTYVATMQSEISRATISCVGRVIKVGGAEKTCMNSHGSDGQSHILCNSERLLKTPESDQYLLVNHEYAGLSGFETNRGSDSQYQISNQMNGFLENKVVKVLAVKPATKDPSRVPSFPVIGSTPTEACEQFSTRFPDTVARLILNDVVAEVSKSLAEKGIQLDPQSASDLNAQFSKHKRDSGSDVYLKSAELKMRTVGGTNLIIQGAAYHTYFDNNVVGIFSGSYSTDNEGNWHYSTCQLDQTYWTVNNLESGASLMTIQISGSVGKYNLVHQK